jgi:predicted secreted protein
MPSFDKLSYGGDLMLFAHSGSTVQPVAFSTSSKLTINMATRTVSSRDSGDWDEIATGKFSWTMSSDALVSFASTGTTQTVEELYSYFVNKKAICVNFAHKTGTTPSWTVDSSKKKFSGLSYITSLDINSSDGDQATYSVNLQGTGVLSIS